MALKKNGLVAFRLGLPAAIDRGVYNAAVAIEDLATQLAPEDSGDLKASGHVEPATPNGSMTYSVVFGGGDVGYARYPVFRTDNPNYPVQPYLHPAAKQISPKVEIQAAIRALAQRSRS